MTDARQLQIFVDCPYGGCEDGYCACLEQDIDDDYFAEIDDAEIAPAELADAYGLDPDEVDRFSLEDLERLLAGLTSGRSMIHRRRIRSVFTLPDIGTYRPEGVRP